VPANTLSEQLTKYLTDAHSIEEQALQQLRRAPGLAGDGELAALYREHLAETEWHERLVRERLEARGAQPSRLKDVVMRVGGLGFLLFARLQPDTPGKLAAHAYSYEHLELAAYELLARVAERAGDEETVEVAYEISGDERRMGERLAAAFDRAVEASLRELAPDDLGEQLSKYLADAHAIEAQAIQLLESAPKQVADYPALAGLFSRARPSLRGAPRGDAGPPAARRGAARRARRRPLRPEGRGAQARRAELGRVLPGAPGHPGEARGVRLRLRAPRDRGLRGAEARREPRRRRRDDRRGRPDPRRGARRGGEARRRLRPRRRRLSRGDRQFDLESSI
jgi:ferritin-like metal-binding protein YciE